MKSYSSGSLRNIGLIAHGGAGKTSVAEAMLFTSGMTDRLGRSDDGNTVMDHDPEEIKRKMSISLSIAPCHWKDAKINIVDTPGYFDFIGDVRAGLRVVDGAIMVVDAVAGVEVGTELFWEFADEYKLPRMIYVNKIDRENASFSNSLDSLRQAFGNSVVPMQMPIGHEASFKGVVDLVSMKALMDNGDGKILVEDIPVDLSEQAKSLREPLLEAAAESDDELIEKYLEGEELSPGEILRGLRKGVSKGQVFPVLVGSAIRNQGTAALLDAVTSMMPSPADAGSVKGTDPRTGNEATRTVSSEEPFSALVFKTMADPYVGKLTVFRVYSGVLRSDSHAYNASKGRSERVGQLFVMKGKHQEPVEQAIAGDLAAVAKLQETGTGDTLCDEHHPIVYQPVSFPAPVYSVAVAPKAKGDEDKIGSGLARLAEEDPTFKVEKNPETLQTLISGMGDLHLDVITDRLKRKFGVDVVLEPPKVPYRETIRGTAKVEGKHKKQTGGRGQYGHVFIEMEPLGPDAETDFEFVDKIFGGAVPRQYIPAVEKGIRETMQEGVIAGYPVSGVRVTLVDGSYHTVDSSEMAFKIASSMAFKKGFVEASPALLEPIMKVEVTVPDIFMGDVMGDLNKKRGKILGMEPRGTVQVIRALAPLSEMFKYSIDLRSITQGRGLYTMEFSHYEEVPAHLAQEIIAQAKKDKEAEGK